VNARLVSEAGAGELLARDFTAEDFFGLVDKIFGDKDYYQKLKDGAVNLAREYDIMKILEERAKDLNII
jgi:UDP-N-acetylglucosamine:LPS N-acetylglucosamine transferase